MLKWGLGLLAVFALLMALFSLAQYPSYLFADVLFYPLTFSGLLGLDLLIAGAIQQFTGSSRPYLLFTVTGTLVCLVLCLYGFYNIATDKSDFLPGLLGILIISYSVAYQLIFLVGAGLHYYFVSRKKKLCGFNSDSFI